MALEITWERNSSMERSKSVTSGRKVPEEGGKPGEASRLFMESGVDTLMEERPLFCSDCCTFRMAGTSFERSKLWSSRTSFPTAMVAKLVDPYRIMLFATH